jgi:hypothetical protein
MLCCSIGVFLLSQLYAGLIGLRALFFGQRDDLDGLIGQAAGRPSRGTLAFSRPRFALAIGLGMAGLSVAYAVNDTAAAHAADWIPIMSSLCSSVAR